MERQGSLNPDQSAGNSSAWIKSQRYDTLYTEDSSLVPVYLLASRWLPPF